MDNKFNIKKIIYIYVYSFLAIQNRADLEAFFRIKKLKYFRKLSFLFFFLFAGVLDGLSSVTVTSAPLATAACTTFPTAFLLKDTIKIAESVNNDFNNSPTDVTLILSAPTNFEFQPGIGSVLVRSDIPNNSDFVSSITVTSTTITVTYRTNTSTSRLDTMFIVGIQIRGVNAASTGNIRRTGGTATIVGNNAGGLVNHGALSSNVGSLPTPSLIAPVSSSVCANQTGVTYTTQGGLNSNYTWSIVGGTITSGGGTSNNSVTVTWGASGSGSVSINYTNFNGCAAASPTVQNITINQPPSASISYAGTPFCKSLSSAQPVTLTGSSGGTFSSTSGLTLNTSNGNITPSSSTPGNYTVTYTIAASGGCAAFSTTTNVTITSSPTATLNYSGSPFCNSLTTAQSPSITGSGGGTFSSTTGLTLNTSNGNITPSSSTIGNYTVTYTIAASGGCAAFSTTDNVTINSAPSASFSYTGSPYCKSLTTSQSPSFSGTTGGTFSSLPAGLTLNTTNGGITPSSSTPGNYTVTYSIAASGGCPVFSTTANVTITLDPSSTTINYAGSPFCNSITSPQSVTILNGPTNGTFSSTPAGLTLNTTNGNIIPSSSTPGTYTVTYSIAANGGCVAFSTTDVITINPAPNATFSYAGSPFCKSLTTSQSPSFTGTTGGTFSSTPTGLTLNATNGGITPSSSTPGSYTVTYSIAASGGCAAFSTTANVTITLDPSSTTINYTGSPFCSSITSSQAVTILNGPTNGTFSSTPTGLTLNTTNGNITPSSSTPGNYTVTYTIAANGGCAAFSTTTTVIISQAPNATINYAGTPYCNSITSPQPVTITILGGPTSGSGTFSSTPPGLSLNNITGAITPSISATNSYTVTYSVPASAGCPVFNINSNIITINSLSIAPDSISTNKRTICNGDNFTLTVNGGSLGTNSIFQWYEDNCGISGNAIGIGNQIIITPNPGSITSPVTKTYFVRAEDPAPCNTNTICKSITITINPVPTLNAISDTAICGGSPVSIALTGSTGSSNTTYGWINSNTAIGLNASSGDGDITFTANNPNAPITSTFIDSAVFTFAGLSCSSTRDTFIVKVDPTPPSPIITELPGNNPVGALNLCVGSANITLGIGSNNGNIQWAFNPIVSGDSITNSNDTITNIIIQSGLPTTITVTSSNNTLPTNCVSKPDTLVINVGANTINSNIIVPFGNVDLAYLDNSLNQYQWGIDSVIQVAANSFKVQKSKIIDGQIYQLLVPPSKFILSNGKLDTLNYWYWIIVYQVNGNDTCRTKVYYNGDYRCSGCKGIQPSNISTDIVALAVPNPSNGIFNIKINGNIYGELNTAIFNTLGEIQDERILVKNNDSQEFYYDNLKLSGGIYFIHIRGEFGENVIVKLIIK